MQPTNKNLIVISGAPGAGKTTLLDALQSRGFTCIPEVARRIIQEQRKAGGNALPWQNTTANTKLMLEGSIASFSNIRTRRVQPSSIAVFQTRSVTRKSFASLTNAPSKQPAFCTAMRRSF